MQKPRPLPEHLRHGAFDRAALADAKVTRNRVRRGDTSNPFHGVHVLGAPHEGAVGRCKDYAVRLRPGQLFSHVTAAQLHGLPLPPNLEKRSAIDVAAVHPAAPPETRGVIGHRLRKEPPVLFVEGLRVCALEETWCQLSAMLDLVELVVIADHVLHAAALTAEAAGADPEEFADAARSRLRDAIAAPGRHRRAILSMALNLARWRSASPGESRARVILVLAGVPEPELNTAVIEHGVRLGAPDLLWRAHRVMVEYESERHRDRQQFRYDIDRYDAFSAAGWTVIRITADNVRPERRAAFIARVKTALGLA